MGALAASSEVVVDRCASPRTLHPGVQVVADPERYRRRQGLEGEYRFCRSCSGGTVGDLIVSQATQAAQSRLHCCATLSWMSCCPPCF